MESEAMHVQTQSSRGYQTWPPVYLILKRTLKKAKWEVFPVTVEVVDIKEIFPKPDDIIELCNVVAMTLWKWREERFIKNIGLSTKLCILFITHVLTA